MRRGEIVRGSTSGRRVLDRWETRLPDGGALGVAIRSALRRFDLAHKGTEVLAHHQQAEAIDLIEFVRAQAGIVELAAQVGVTILEEARGPILQLREDLHVAPRERLAIVLLAKFQAPIAFDEAQVEAVGTDRGGAGPPPAVHLDEDVLAGKGLGHRETE